MSDPREALAQLLSESQAEVLAEGAAGIWESVASALAAILGSAPEFQELDARIVMPDEIGGEFEDGHLVAPLSVTTDHDQSATAYLVVNTGLGAIFLESQADEPGDEEQQTMVMASAVAGQVVSGINSTIFADSPNGLVVATDEMTANSMPMLLSTMEEPGLLLTGTIQGDRVLPLSLLLPGTFLDIVSVSFPDGETGPGPEEAEEPASEGPPTDGPAADAEDAPFTFSMEDLQGVEDAEEGALPEEAPPEAPPEPPPAPEPVAADPGSREPTPISKGAVHRATFTPFGDQGVSEHRSSMALLAGLDMNVTVELGRTEMTVSEVLAMGPGHVFELDRLAGEPVDILVNDRIIAHGEVVVVDENFGVRVIEVLKPLTEPGQTG
jgi:flagellar motor switch protein FliN